MSVTVTQGSGGVSATIGTNAAQALRLEFGFHGADRLGRVYSQAPLPHWRPMWEWLQGQYSQTLAAAMVRALGGA
jgi:hypothetical protein